ncbi:GTP 3',8-cyclase MoaA [Amycolatopsis sp.]|jgi:cyclic pyranopterin phosphate synthase|uniref:GTP 3',8-cyclase MoaA n=1 Tax=Amycolatopsis sp. TaxID=37632 RepID=UPI002E020662|nr:GTP 3',8-cyclase MoaA [Amycolatopsis sp.]
MTLALPDSPAHESAGDPGPDRRGRALRDLRISVTDRCNFRCTYCMPRDEFGPDHAFLSRRALLDFDEITRVATTFVGMGVRKIRLTGGEPLARRGICDLIARLAAINDGHGSPGVDLALTTNGSLLPRLAPALAEAGLHRVTVSLDTIDDAVFRAMTDSRFGVGDVLAGIDAAANAGLGPVKINTVVQRGVNDGDELRGVLDLAEHFRGTGHTVRFIEFMDVGSTNGWRHDQVVPSREILAALDTRFGVEPVGPAYLGEVADRYRYRDGAGEIGFIRSVSAPFCGTCTRARLSADGKLYTCLFATAGTDLRAALRSGVTDTDLADLIAGRWRTRDDRYSEQRGAAGARPSPAGPRIEMSYIGG